MNQKTALAAIKKARENSKKRNFSQTFELIINLKGVDLKKTESQLDFFVPLHFPLGKEIRVCALVGPELAEEAKKSCHTVITQDEFEKYAADKKAIKKLAAKHDFFIAQANIMTKVASVFGRVLGPKGKMPNPKAGCVVPPKTNLQPLIEKLKKTVHVKARTSPVIQVPVGKESMPDEEIADNLLGVYNQVIHHLPNEEQNIKDVYVKLTMGKPVKVE